MTNARRKRAIRVLTKEISKFTIQLNRLYDMQKDIKSKEGNLLPKMWIPYIDASKIEADCQKLSKIIADLKTVREAMKLKKTSACLISTDSAGMSPIELCNSLDVAFGSSNYENDGFSNKFYFY